MDKELKNVIESNKEINRIWKNVGLAGLDYLISNTYKTPVSMKSMISVTCL